MTYSPSTGTSAPSLPARSASTLSSTVHRRDRRWTLALLVLATCAAVLSGWLRFRGPALGYWDIYIATPAMILNATPVDFVLADGTPAWNYHLSGVLPNDLLAPSSYGIATKDQRFGSAVAAAQGFAFAGILGFRLTFCLCLGLLPALGLTLWRRVRPQLTDPAAPARDWLGVLLGTWLALNPFTLAIDRLNPSVFALPLVLLVLTLVADRRRENSVARALLAGILLGLCASMREEVVCLVPALGAWMLWGPADFESRQRWQRIVALSLACVVAMIPTLLWKQFIFGDPLMHPSQYAHHDGFRPEFEHQFGSLSFKFNGLLNWPFIDQLVRTPHFAFPVWLLWPLVTLKALGLAGAALVAIGWLQLWQRARATAWLSLGIAGPLYLLFGPQENWEEVKMTFLLLALPAVALPLAQGLAWAADVATTAQLGPRRLLAVQGRLLGLSIAVAATLGGGLVALQQWQVPVDRRWYARFPNADPAQNPTAAAQLTESERGDWTFFQRADHPDELERERHKLTTLRLLPTQYLPVRWQWQQAMEQTVVEMGARRWRVLDIWGYIYGVRRWP